MTYHPPRERCTYTTGEVAKMLRLSRRTVSDWARTGRIEAIRPGRRWRIPAAVVRRLFEQELSSG